LTPELLSRPTPQMDGRRREERRMGNAKVIEEKTEDKGEEESEKE